MAPNSNSNIEILLMQPIEMPNELLSLLSNYFRSTANISKAYFSIVQFSDRLESDDYLIAIDANLKADIDLEIEKVRKYVSTITLNTHGKRVILVDVHQTPYDSFFQKKKPFYPALMHE